MQKPEMVRPGQMYVDNDVRSKYDEFTIIGTVEGSEVKHPYAICQRGPRKTNIRIERLLAPETPSKGYRYIGMKR